MNSPLILVVILMTPSSIERSMALWRGI